LIFTERNVVSRSSPPLRPDRGTGLAVRLGYECAEGVYQPGYDAERAVADYISWLRAGNER
jgi:hypothetical protein